MDPISQQLMMGAAGSGGPKLYVEDVFSTWLYTGNDSTQTITNGIDLSGKGGLVWIKDRTVTINHCLFDTARGTTKYLSTNATTAETTGSDSLTSFNNSGFTLDADSTTGAVNRINDRFASWTFRKAAKFFDVVTYTGTGSARTIAHNLGSVPGCIIVKRTDIAADWQVYHRSLANTEYLVLNNTTAKAAADRWNSTTPTSTVFSLGTAGATNASGGTYVAYLFAHDAGGFGDSGNDNVISCGSYTGNGSTSGPTITLGWEPQWLLIKRTDSAGYSWFMHDNMRQMSLTNSAYLIPDSSSAESLWGSALFNPTATGFQLNTSNPSFNGSGGTYIYIAIRRGPMKTPTDATKVFAASLGAATTPAFTSNFPVDLALTSYRSGGGGNNYVVDRLRGQTALQTPSAAAEGAVSALWKLDQQTGFAQSSGGWGSTHVCSMFRRAPGFFDVVAYTGDGNTSTTMVPHGLTVQPELMIIKGRSSVTGWDAYVPSNASNYYLVRLNDTGAQLVGNVSRANASSSTVLKVGWLSGNVNGINDLGSYYIAYLFASCPGVSKVGSYTGTGTTLNVDCGFTNGARFVLIKRTDSTGGWYVWDTARGIIAANDPYLLLNSTAAEVTNTDYIDPLSSGFQISSTAPAAINANGGSFIFLAVA